MSYVHSFAKCHVVNPVVGGHPSSAGCKSSDVSVPPSANPPIRNFGCYGDFGSGKVVQLWFVSFSTHTKPLILPWAAGAYSAANTALTNDFDGSKNVETARVINADLSGFPAIRYCAELSYSGYTDWYLPSNQELKRIVYEFKNNNLGYEGAAWASSTELSGTSFVFAYNSAYNETAYSLYFQNRSATMGIICVRRE